jgi:hypothetical protein
MRIQRAKKVATWLLYVALLTGMFYSGMSLTASTAYAATCDCEAAQQEAVINCWPDGVTIFECPAGDGSHYAYVCYPGVISLRALPVGKIVVVRRLFGATSIHANMSR